MNSFEVFFFIIIIVYWWLDINSTDKIVVSMTVWSSTYL